jgi:hypothetical protein
VVFFTIKWVDGGESAILCVIPMGHTDPSENLMQVPRPTNSGENAFGDLTKEKLTVSPDSNLEQSPSHRVVSPVPAVAPHGARTFTPSVSSES